VNLTVTYDGDRLAIISRQCVLEHKPVRKPNRLGPYQHFGEKQYWATSVHVQENPRRLVDREFSGFPMTQELDHGLLCMKTGWCLATATGIAGLSEL
jgi:hypothetical protein